MPFDVRSFPIPATTGRHQRAVAVWLFAICAMILVMIALGGATRLTGSGLSIMEWAPIMGALPPLSEAEWQRLFTLYQAIPQYSLVHEGFGLEGFKHIFWLEWTHRLWGRLLGFAFAVPLVVFAIRGWLPRGIWPRLLGLLLLGGLQGAVGWFMVASGFEADSTAVSPYRLVVHLALALTLYAAILWMALTLYRGPATAPVNPSLRRLSGLMLALVSLTILAGGFVAGLKAGLTYNSFPLMDGHLIPPGYAALQPFLRNLTENIPAVQFDHRLLATLTAGLGLFLSLRFTNVSQGAARATLLVLGAIVLAQYALGIATLLSAVPVSLGTAHQALAVLVLTTALVLRHTQRRAP